MVDVKQAAGILGISALVGLGVGGTVAATHPAPDVQPAVVTTVGAPEVVIDDPQDILSREDEARLRSDAGRLDVPYPVQKLHYLVFNKTRDNVNDSVEEYIRDNRPEEILNDTFADGVLILGAGTDQRKVFAFAGEDVADELHLRPGDRLEAVNDAMKPGMRDNNIPAALFAGASKATDVDELAMWGVDNARSQRTADISSAGFGAGVATTAASMWIVTRRNKRRKEIAQAREDYQLATREYAELGQRLNEVDVRANSLTSAFADAQLRKEWAEVRERFLGMHETVSGAGGIGSIDMNDDKQVWEHRQQLGDAAEAVRHASNAEDNINRLFAVEQGDAAARRADLTDLREDVIAASMEVKDTEVRRRLGELERRIDELDRNPSDPGYLDEFVRVLGDYRVVLDQVKRHQFNDVTASTTLERPRLYDDTYRYPNYVPFVVLNSWHTSNVEAQQSSSATNSFFSSGFSGSGGSSSY